MLEYWRDRILEGCCKMFSMTAHFLPHYPIAPIAPIQTVKCRKTFYFHKIRYF